MAPLALSAGLLGCAPRRHRRTRRAWRLRGARLRRVRDDRQGSARQAAGSLALDRADVVVPVALGLVVPGPGCGLRCSWFCLLWPGCWFGFWLCSLMVSLHRMRINGCRCRSPPRQSECPDQRFPCRRRSTRGTCSPTNEMGCQHRPRSKAAMKDRFECWPLIAATAVATSRWSLRFCQTDAPNCKVKVGTWIATPKWHGRRIKPARRAAVLGFDRSAGCRACVCSAAHAHACRLVAGLVIVSSEVPKKSPPTASGGLELSSV